MSVLVSLDPVRKGIKVWKGQADPDWLDAGDDARSFRLDRAKPTDCLPVASDKEEAAALKRGD